MKHLLRKTISALLFGCALGTLQAQTLSDSLIAHFHMDGSPDDVIGGLTPIVTAGLPGYCAGHDGSPNGAACFYSSDFWSYGDVLDMDSADFSIACWMYVDSVHAPFQPQPGFWDYGGIPICKGLTVVANPTRSGYALLVREPQPGSFTIHWGTGSDNNDVVDAEHSALLDAWQHVVMSRCGTHQLLYIDGVLVADSLTPAVRNLNTDIYFTLGAMNRDPNNGTDSEFFTGALDDVRIYKGRCLSETEIDTLAFDLGMGIPTPATGAPSLRIYPSPASDLINIQFSSPFDPVAPMMVFDYYGRKVDLPASKLDVGPAGILSMELPIAGLSPGAYFVTLTDGKGTRHGRFVKE